ncbi:hypothetical protein AYO44_14200 [Planctomycetaceae bacterium SCGC AG-212-F19]|nr:hypothetical protein AYO44_14200 [Planctomycetaceae bacterium SCGC AG-212-F19]
MCTMLILTACFSLLAGACSDPAAGLSAGKDSPEAGPTTALKRDPIGCTIEGEPTCALGKAPNVRIILTNQTDADIYLVGSLDASDCKWRYPHCFFEVTGPDGAPVARRILRCGNKNTLREKDFVKVRPGGTFDPYQRVDEYGFFSAHQLDPDNFKLLGKYRIRFGYSTKSEDLAAWAGDGGPAVAANDRIVAMFKGVSKVEVMSNELMITVVEGEK